jgi:glyceraldehyde 3-phosphate dehydrogenase
MGHRIAINGFGRIGRCITRALGDAADLEVVAINDITDAKTLAHLLKYDSVHGPFKGSVEAREKAIVVNGREIKVLAEKDPALLPWRALGVNVALECTGRFRKRAEIAKHLDAGARKVIVSAPADDADITVVTGVNDDVYDARRHHVLSNASCSTNCLSLVVKAVFEKFGIEKGFMTTIHSYTNDQRILDLPHSDLRRARAAALSMIPTTTGAARAVSLVLPALAGKLDGISIRVPTPNVSLIDLTAITTKSTTREEVNATLRAAAEGPFRGLMRYCDEPLVSSDFNGDAHSAVIDSDSTNVVDGNLVKVFAWYDNEMGFSHRMVDLAKMVTRNL